ncbi:MAG: hypothetical protein K2W96_26950, partial [Gemmataceae bacterium]|nr:hypothetical protein [Gemmataceae bacterium]
MTRRTPEQIGIVRLHAPLSGARLADPDAPLPSAVSAVAPSSLLPAPQAPPPPPPPAPVLAGWEERGLIERTLEAVGKAVGEAQAQQRAE